MTEIILTPTSVQSEDDIRMHELRTARKSLSEQIDKNEVLRLRIIELENENAKLKEINDILVRKPRYEVIERPAVPPWGS